MSAVLAPADRSASRWNAAVVTAAQVPLRYAAQGRTLAQAALAGAREFVEWAHYPRDDLVDDLHGSRFYYHAHAAAERAEGEHGHFHLFVAAPEGAAPGFSHLAGLSLDDRGLPTRWFTTNAWVTGEHWQDAGQMRRALARFGLQARGRLAPLAGWLDALVRLYADDIDALLVERDERVAALARAHGNLAAALEDRSVHIVSQRPADLLGRLAALSACGRP